MQFTIIATVRNEISTITAFLDSLLEQTRKPDEILIVDGASNDGTREILEDYAQRGLLRFISQPCNIAEGRNLGIAAATGTHLAVTDAGCRVDPDWLAQIEHCFQSDCKPDVVAGNFRFETHTPFEEAVVLGTFQPNRDQSVAARYYPSSRSVAFTKEAWQQAGGYPEWLYAAEDTLFNIRMRQLGLRFTFCRDAIVRWRPRETWRALARQRINFSRGNARVGIGTTGYLTNLQAHSLFAVLMVAGIWFSPALLGALAVAALHVYHHLWPQARRATDGRNWTMRLRVMTVMEFVRVINLYGFLLGRWDRYRDPIYIKRQIAYMGVPSVDYLDLSEASVTSRKRRLRLPTDRGAYGFNVLLILTGICGLIAWFASGDAKWIGLQTAAFVAAVGSVVLLLKSVAHFSQTGPRINKEILTHYRRYTIFALARLALWAFILMLFASGIGLLLYFMLTIVQQIEWLPWLATMAAAFGIVGAFVLQFIVKLRFNPGLLVASMHYRMSRLYLLWQWMTPARIVMLQTLWLGASALLLVTTSWVLAQEGRISDLIALWAGVMFFAGIVACAAWQPEARPPSRQTEQSTATPPNILMIGSDTLRADRIRPDLTPNIHRLAQRGVHFTHCYVPCARTAPSLISLLTGTWPHTHGVRDNFVADADTDLSVSALPQWLADIGYHCAAISDWCGADMGKFNFGFHHLDLPEDQWNLKYLIRQGPKDLRLFLSLFLHNALGRLVLPELYYLGGVPLSSQIGRRARHLVARLAERQQPFFLNCFYSTTHPPFASEYPWYVRYADPSYDGASKFAMARLNDPFDIIRRQGEPREEFDLEQILRLYDGSVAQFDHEVGLMLDYLEKAGLADNTIVVIYSDHGMEFFEHATWGQGNSVIGEVSPRIPFILADPRRAQALTVSEITRSIDIAPTLLELAGGSAPSSIDGVSLAPLMRNPGESLNLPAFNETGIWLTDIPGLADDHLRYPGVLDIIEIPDIASGTLALKPEFEELILRAKDRMVRLGKWKLIYQPTRQGYTLQLFDVQADPECRANLYNREPETACQLWRLLQDWIEADPRLNLRH